MTTEDAMVLGLTDAWDELTMEMKPNHCILAARVMQEVGAYFGVPVTVRATEVVVANAKGWDLIGRNVPMTEWPDDAWSIGVVHAVQGNDDYSGHVVAETPRWHVDLSAGQFSRPKKGIVVGGPLVLLKQPDHDPTESLFLTNDDGSVIVYYPSTDTAYRRGPDWTTNYRPLAAAAIRHLREMGVHQQASRGTVVPPPQEAR